MKTILIALIILLNVNSYGQEFAFKLYFQDSKGNKDTITLGYDKSATDTIDLSQGEINIIDKPLDKEFDVRVSNIWNRKNLSQINDSFQTKRQIVKDNCGGWFPPVIIDLFCTNWPISVKWDSTLFNSGCNIGSLLTSFHPGGWFDVGGGFITELTKTSGMKIQKYSSSDLSTYENSSEYYYVNKNNDTIYVFWQAFGDVNLPKLDVNEYQIQNDFIFYPNPAKRLMFLKGDINQVQSITVFDMAGNQRLYTKSDIIDLNVMIEGIYIARINLKNGKVINRKIIYVR